MNKNILIVDDTETNIDILLELLSDKYEVSVALDGQSALEIVADENIDLILLDIMMPNIDGFKVCQQLKENKLTKNIPVIFITAKTDEDSIEKAYEVGGIDYVTKPFKSRELLARVKTQLTMQKLIKDLESSHEELKLLASTDHMTKLYNRRYFSKISDHILNLAKRDKVNTSLVMLDIDKFKNINDTYGHQVGDNVIIYLAEKLIEFTRNSDIVCRFGGEEFIILLPETTVEGALVISNKIKDNIENGVINLEFKRELKFTVSIGISQVSNDEDLNIEAAINRADAALYKAKQNGRNKICMELNKYE